MNFNGGEAGDILIAGLVALGTQLGDCGVEYFVVQSATAFKTSPNDPS
ncbi:hypothetical protein OG717_02105 [Streptomyces celluloflavus]|nr:hypothetical protein OG717_02105 [Streptomyces celluloflavus]